MKEALTLRIMARATVPTRMISLDVDLFGCASWASLLIEVADAASLSLRFSCSACERVGVTSESCWTDIPSGWSRTQKNRGRSVCGSPRLGTRQASVYTQTRTGRRWVRNTTKHHPRTYRINSSPRDGGMTRASLSNRSRSLLRSPAKHAWESHSQKRKAAYSSVAFSETRHGTRP